MVNLHDAIRAVNSFVVTIRGNVAYDSNEQIIEFDMAQAEAKLVELEQAEQATKDAKASALAKLAALGLTQDEVKALVG